MATINNSPAKSKSKFNHRSFSEGDKFYGEGLTFDDVLLMPAYSQILPREVNISTTLTKTITLHVPLLSAAMETVTEAALAIALAREGGLGILHKNMSIDQQADQVRKAKRSESGLILDPVTLHPDAALTSVIGTLNTNYPAFQQRRKNLVKTPPGQNHFQTILPIMAFTTASDLEFTCSFS